MSGGCGLGMVFGRPADPDKHWPHARFEQISTWQKRDSLRNPLQCGEFQQVLRYIRGNDTSDYLRHGHLWQRSGGHGSEAGFGEICIFSCDEKKQDDMRNQMKIQSLKFYPGNERDYNSVL